MTIKTTIRTKSDFDLIRRAAKSAGLLPATWARLILLDAAKKETRIKPVS